MTPARLGHPPGPTPGPRDSRAVRGEAGIGIHHAINSGDEHKCQPPPARLDKFGALPNAAPTVEAIPYLLGARAYFFRRHHRMIPIQFGTKRLRYEPASGQWNSGNGRRMVAQCLFPANEIYGPRIGA